MDSLRLWPDSRGGHLTVFPFLAVLLDFFGDAVKIRSKLALSPRGIWVSSFYSDSIRLTETTATSKLITRLGTASRQASCSSAMSRSSPT